MTVRLPDISSNAWEHPSDRAALGALKQIPGFDLILRKAVGAFGDRNIRMIYQAESVRVGPNQYPDIHEILLNVADTLDTQAPPLFVSQAPHANAGAIGLDKPFIILSSSIVEHLSPEQLAFVVGHEVGHVMSEHALYRTLLRLMLDFSTPLTPIVGRATLPITLALLEWSRKSEISCDRAGLLATQNLDAGLGGLGIIAGGIRGREADINVPALVEQSQDYADREGLDAFFRFMAKIGRSHSFPMIRIGQLQEWHDGGQYESIMGGDYPLRGEEGPLVDDLARAQQSYSETAQQVFTNADEYVNKTLIRWTEAVASARPSRSTDATNE